jgi:hypothetical protein
MNLCSDIQTAQSWHSVFGQTHTAVHAAIRSLANQGQQKNNEQCPHRCLAWVETTVRA